VIRNYRNPIRKKKPVTTVTTPCPGTAAAAVSPRSGVAQSVRDVAMCRFFANFITGGARTGYMTYLLPLIGNPRNSAVNAAVNAVSMAALSNIRLSPRTMLKAQREYTTALREINLALQDPTLCKRDDTLAAVDLLGLFEVRAARSPNHLTL
jgi:hypothetical protein